MNVKLNKRLSAVSAFINEKDQIIDIGCDHGLLGIYVYQKYHNKVISSDINSMPLKKAYDNLVKYNLQRSIILKQGNGLLCLDDDINTVIISGMGGITIIEILKNIQKYPHVNKLIISPNNDFPLTRKKISQLGFTIEEEVLVQEKNKYYLVSVYKKGHKKYHSFFGKLDLNNDDVIHYYQNIYYKNKSILKNIPNHQIRKKLQLSLENYLIVKKHLTLK